MNVATALNFTSSNPLDPSGKDNFMPSSPAINFDESYKPHPLACDKCGWIIGVVMKVKTPNASIRRLWVFTSALAAKNDMPPIADLRSTRRNLYRVRGLDRCEGDGCGVECSHCGWLTPWSMSMESYLRLISHYQKAEE